MTYVKSVCILTEHNEGGCPLLISRGVGGVLAGVAAGICHSQVGNPNRWVFQAVMEEDDSVFEKGVGEALSIGWVVHSNVVPLAIDGFPYPGHLQPKG